MIKLGEDALYPEMYDPSLLQAIARAPARGELQFEGEHLPFDGKDFWTAYELSWLNQRGLPRVYLAEFTIPATSPCIVESKSFKYYLNSFNQTRFDTPAEVEACLRRDLGALTEADVEVRLEPVEMADTTFLQVSSLPGECIDKLDIEINEYSPNPKLLRLELGQQVSRKALVSHLLKSNCPVTGQPDWASLWIEYSGALIKPESVLAYVISFRQHQGFHENCVERIFTDVLSYCKPTELTVYARYTRRGGLDINPLRTNCGRAVPQVRLVRQ